MKNLFYAFLACLIITSCSDSNEPPIPDTDPEISNPEPVTFEIKTLSDSGNIFELMQFQVSIDDDRDLRTTYDSLIWTIQDTQVRLNVFTYTNSGGHFYKQWGQEFFLPGEHQAVLLGYKGNQVSYSDTVTINIINQKDFLGCNWEDVAGSIPYNPSYRGLCQDYDLNIVQSFNQNVPSITAYLYTYNEIDEDVFNQQSEESLFEYICSLYGTPTYGSDNDDLLVKSYNLLFKNKKEGSKPLYIWITPQSKMVMLQHKSTHREPGEYRAYRGEYEIYAEPNKE